MPSTAMITERLDDLESRLPVIPAKVLHLQRVIAGKTYDNYVAYFGAVADSYRSFFDTAVASSRAVSDQARAAGEQLVSTLTNGVKSVAGQAVAQGRRVSEAAESEVTDLVDSAIDAVEDAPGTGTPYEQWTKAELVERAKELEIVGPTRMSKKELIKALRAA
jgi:hypothetical protein